MTATEPAASNVAPEEGRDPGRDRTDRRGWLTPGRLGLLAFVLGLVALAPTTGDIGVTWDEPSYQYSQVLSEHWWSELAAARSWSDVQALLEPDALVYYWPYAYHGINFHPPLAGQLNLLTHVLLGAYLEDMVSRRMADVVISAVLLAILAVFLARRYSLLAGLVAAGSLLLMPRAYAHMHLAGTDTPGLVLWVATALAFWKAVEEPGGRPWRAVVGVLLGLAFLEKMAAVLVLLPIGIWLGLTRLPGALALWRRGVRLGWIDAVVTLGLMAIPLGLAGYEILSLASKLPPPSRTRLMEVELTSAIPGAILGVPALIWVGRRLLARVWREHAIWGADRPALETIQAIAALAPLVGWLGHPLWWSKTLVRPAHYYTLNTDRRDALPDIQIIWFNQIYEYSLPWPNAFILTAITVPLSILAAAVVGMVLGLLRIRKDWLPLFFLVNALVLPAARMLPTPGHDGVRLFLPTFAFLAAFAGLGVGWVAAWAGKRVPKRAGWIGAGLALATLAPAAVELVRVHPYELSYYNPLIGGPEGASHAGLELTYWYDPYNPSTLAEINELLPEDAAIQVKNDISNTPTFLYLQQTGAIRPDVTIGTPSRDRFPFIWLPTHHSKSSAMTRLLYAMEPWYEVRPDQLDGARVASVADPKALSRAWALWLLLDHPAPPEEEPEISPVLPDWTRSLSPRGAEVVEKVVGRFRGEGLTLAPALTVNEEFLAWAREEPETLRRAAEAIAADPDGSFERGSPEARLLAVISRYDRPTLTFKPSQVLLRGRPQSLVDAVKLVIERPEDLRTILTTARYLEPDEVGGYLDEDLD